MNTKMFSEAMGEVDDKYYEEAANYQPKRKKSRWVKWGGAAAACLCLAAIGILVLPKLFGGGALRVTPAAYPYVMVNDVIYHIENRAVSRTASELPQEYVEIGKIEGNAPLSQAKNWYSEGCQIGEAIYQDPAKPNEIYVYTTFFSGNGEYRYFCFTSRG